MQVKEIIIQLREYSSVRELEEVDQQLVIAAREAARDAYAPYSKFCVGAAVRLSNGVVIKGNNQENAASPSGLCAERVALFYANANYPDIPVEAMAVSAVKGGKFIENSVKPCGACRQVIIESEHRFKRPMMVILDGGSNIEVFESGSSLLPFAFISDSLD